MASPRLWEAEGDNITAQFSVLEMRVVTHVGKIFYFSLSEGFLDC